jgi:uncharacterized protein (TIGR02996 family)
MRYELKDRFWSIRRTGAVLTITSGKIGNRGRTVVKHHASDAAARVAHDELVIEKHREGYRRAAGDTEPEAPAIEPLDPERTAALETTITENPEDRDAYAVYGDFLQKHGDPRGELIALMQAGSSKAGNHIAEHAPRLLGPLAKLVRDLRESNAPPFFWANGFIRRAELATMKGITLDSMLELLLAHPSGKFLRELALRADDRREALACLRSVRQAQPRLREIDLFARANLDHIVWQGMPPVEQLGITARAFELVDIDAPTVKRARFRATSLASATVQAVAKAPWPVLERLELRFSSQTGASEADFHDLRPLLLRTDLPALTHLKFRGCAFAGMITRTLASAPIAKQLVALDFAHCNFSPQDIALLGQQAGNFPNLHELWMPFAQLNALTMPVLAPVAKHVLPDSRLPIDVLDRDLAGETMRTT